MHWTRDRKLCETSNICWERGHQKPTFYLWALIIWWSLSILYLQYFRSLVFISWCILFFSQNGLKNFRVFIWPKQEVKGYSKINLFGCGLMYLIAQSIKKKNTIFHIKTFVLFSFASATHSFDIFQNDEETFVLRWWYGFSWKIQFLSLA